MSGDVQQGQRARPRAIRLVVQGDTAEETELAALDKAREFFGTGPRLEVVADYQVHEIGPHAPEAVSGKKYGTAIEVRVVEP